MRRALPASVTVERDIVYARYGAREVKLYLYLYLPTPPAAGKNACIVGRVRAVEALLGAEAVTPKGRCAWPAPRPPPVVSRLSSGRCGTAPRPVFRRPLEASRLFVRSDV